MLLVPLIFTPTDEVLSEAVNAYVEVPKTAALRTLVGLMTILCILEWVLKGGLNRHYSIANYSRRLIDWIQEQPARWVVIAATAYIVVALISTLLSVNFFISVWGEVSGQFGYSAYTLLSYFLLFTIIATHLKTPSQLYRLLGVIVATGAIVAIYGIFQHFDLDPWDLGETGSFRITATFANPVFTGAFLVGTTLLTFGFGITVLNKLGWSVPRVILWIALISAQLIAVYWTDSRGSWILGVPAGLAAFLIIPTLLDAFAAWRRDKGIPSGLLSLSGVVLSVAILVIIGQLVLLGQLNIEAMLVLLVIIILLGLLGVISLFAIWFSDKAGDWLSTFAKTFLVLSASLVITFLVVGFSQEDAVAVQDRFSPSFEGGRASSFRTDIWRGSLDLITDRPWFEYEDLSLSFWRPLVGYGPEIFRYTFPLASPLGGLLSQAHNFFLHHWVEQGALGFLASIWLIASFFLVGSAQLLRNWNNYSSTHRWILITLLAAMVGKVAEMLVGVNREPDLIILWIMLAILVVLPNVMAQEKSADMPQQGQNEPPPNQPPPKRKEKRRAKGGKPDKLRLQPGIGGIGELNALKGVTLALIAVVVISLGWLSWDKNIDYVWAAAIAADGRDHFQAGDFQEAQRLVSKAVSKAPDVPIYYHNLAGIYESYRRFKQNNPNAQLPGCAQFFSLEPDSSPEIDSTDERCAEEAYLSALKGFEKNQTSPQTKLILANATLELAVLGREDKSSEAIRYYDELTKMIPASWPLHNALATAYIRLGLPAEALPVIDNSLALTGNSAASDRAYLLQGISLEQLGRTEEAIVSYQQSLNASSTGTFSDEVRSRLNRLVGTGG